MKTELISLLNTFKYPVRLQGSIAETEAYPESFFTIWNSETEDGNHYDDGAVCTIWDFDVNFYSTDPALVNTILSQVKELLITNGWIIDGTGRDLPTDEPSHTGRGITVLFREENYKQED